MGGKDLPETSDSIELTGTMNAHAAEALRLEIRRLAQARGLEIQELRVEKVGKPDTGGADG